MQQPMRNRPQSIHLGHDINQHYFTAPVSGHKSQRDGSALCSSSSQAVTQAPSCSGQRHVSDPGSVETSRRSAVERTFRSSTSNSTTLDSAAAFRSTQWPHSSSPLDLPASTGRKALRKASTPLASIASPSQTRFHRTDPTLPAPTSSDKCSPRSLAAAGSTPSTARTPTSLFSSSPIPRNNPFISKASKSPVTLKACDICVEERPLSEFPSAPITATCTHDFGSTCKECIRRHLATQLSSRGDAALTCICNEPLTAHDVQRNADRADFARYCERATLNAVEQDPRFVWCPANGCGEGQIHRYGAEEPIVTCFRCRLRFCFEHRVPWHEGLTCHEYEQQENGQEVASDEQDERLPTPPPSPMPRPLRRRRSNSDESVAIGPETFDLGNVVVDELDVIWPREYRYQSRARQRRRENRRLDWYQTRAVLAGQQRTDGNSNVLVHAWLDANAEPWSEHDGSGWAELNTDWRVRAEQRRAEPRRPPTGAEETLVFRGRGEERRAKQAQAGRRRPEQRRAEQELTEAATQAQKRQIDDKASMAYIKGHTKPCPGEFCRYVIEKNGGCKHMTCMSQAHPFHVSGVVANLYPF